MVGIDEPSSKGLGRQRLACVLLAAGLALALGVVVLVGVSLYDVEKLPLIDYVLAHVGNGHTIVDVVIGSRSLRVRGSHSFGYAFSISVYASLLFAVATIARALITNGARLLRH